MTSFAHKSDPRRRQYARFAQTVLESLRASVDRRTEEGLTKREIAGRIDLAPSSLTRILNGRVRNLTVKTISDILWATEHEPREFGADALEDISPNYRPQHLAERPTEASLVGNRATTIVIGVQASSPASASTASVGRVLFDA